MHGSARRILGERWLRVALLSILLGIAGAVTAQPQERTPIQLGQGIRCQKCHKEIVADFPASLHGRSVKFPNGSDAATCDACHGDGSKHLRTGEPADIHLPLERQTELCLSCHQKDQSRHGWKGSAHDRKNMNCNSCHSTHHAKAESMLRTSVLELCFSCHKDIQKALHQRSTHLFRTEQQVAKLDCTSCHDAHGGQGRKMLVASSTNQVCYTCHAEKRGPFLWEHPPVREDCFTCHVPHGSNQLSLLRTRSHMLCQQCHMNMLWRHQTVAGFDIFTFNRGCVNCHSQVHGSNHPSGKGFTR